MKSGSSQTKPVMSSRPPGSVPRTAIADLQDLDKVSAITEAPARAAAGMLEEGGAPVAVAAPAPKPVKPTKAVMPWEEVEEGGVISFNFKLPAKLGAKLKFLGDTTYGESMTSIVIDALTPKVDKMLKDAGRI